MSTRSSRWKILATMLSATALLLLFAACGGDDDNATTTVTPTLAPGQTAAPTAEPTAEPTGDNGNSDDPFAELDNLTGDIQQQTGKVTYNVTNSDGTVTTMTFYSDADSKSSRFDTTDSDGSTTSFITNGDGSFSCDSSSQICIDYGSSGLGAGLGLGFASFFSSDYISAYVAAAQAAGVSVDTSSETYAGMDATCFSWTDPSDSTSSGKICFGGDHHILVYEEFGDTDGTTKFEATDYSSDVSSSDFETPYPVTTIPTG